jgi:hypothetical protein
MKITSRILSLFFSEMKPDYISMELIFITVFFRAQWLLLITLLSHTVKVINDAHAGAARSEQSHRLALCHEI